MESEHITQEEFTATSLSCNKAFDYGNKELMIIYIPGNVVHGLVIHTKQGGTGNNRDSEILLVHPRLRECSAEASEHLKSYFYNEMTEKEYILKKDIEKYGFTFWVYEGCAKWEFRVSIVSDLLYFVRNGDKYDYECDMSKKKCTQTTDVLKDTSYYCIRNPENRWQCTNPAERQKAYAIRTLIW